MIDALQDIRISALERALERALASLTGVTTAAHPGPDPAVASNLAKPATDTRQDARIASLESAVLALSNSVTLLNQQVASLSAELQKQTDSANMITITPAPTTPVDSAQNARLDDIDTMVKSLTENVADYNQQMASLIMQYQSLQKKSKTRPATFGTHPA